MEHRAGPAVCDLGGHSHPNSHRYAAATLFPVKTAAKFGLVAVVALGLVVLPGGGSALEVALTLLTISFFAAIGLLAYRLYREHRFEIDSLQQSQRLVLYASIGLAFLTFTATNRLFHRGGP